MNSDSKEEPTPSPDGSDSPPANGGSGDDRDHSWSREYLIAQIVIVAAVVAVVAGAGLSEDRGLFGRASPLEKSDTPSAGFSIIQSGSAPPTVCPGAPEGKYPTAEGGLADDCATLLSAGSVLAGSGDLDWSVEVPVTQWPGVIAGGDPVRVIALDLTASGLSGAIPPSLSDLSALQALHLYGNELTGEIPPELGRLADLTILDLGSNRLTGEIPPEVGDMANLTWMDLSFNDLSGPVPAELFALEGLEWLVISGNGLTGSITGKLDGLTRLTYLSLHDTSLTGCLPDFLRDVDGFLGDLPFCDDL